METAVVAQVPPCSQDPDNWAHGIRTVKGAYILPSPVRAPIQTSGVYDQDRSYCHDAVLWRSMPLMVPAEAPDFQTQEPMLKGTYLWGGILHAHFGHFLVESLGRLWGLAATKAKITGVLFLEKRRDMADQASVAWHSEAQPILKGFQTQMFDQLGVTAPIGMIRRPVRVERLLVPGQGFGMGEMSAGTPAFRRFVQARLGKDIAPEGPERLYISRSAYGPRRGGIIGEEVVEKRLESDGYSIFHPQQADIRTQIARYKAAREIIALDGSALHLLAMAGNPSQKIAMIKRRRSPMSKGVELHLTSFLGSAPLVINAIKDNWIRSDRTQVDRFSLAELDFPATGQALEEGGMATSGGWENLDEETRQAAVAALNEQGRFTFRLYEPEARPKLPRGIVATCHGIEVPKSHAVGPRWLVRKINNGRYEKEEIAGALHLVRGDDRVLECGAGIGVVGTTVAHNCKPQAIRSFEANPHLIEVVEATYKRNKVEDRISVTHGALMAGGDLPETITFNIAKRFAFSSLDAPQKELSETVAVPVHDFDKVKSDFNPTVLLMDIEGGELDFLEKADLSGINVIVMEFHPDVYGVDGMERCKSLIRKAGLEPVARKSTETVWAARRPAHASKAA